MKFDFTGHVYDLQSDTGTITAGGIIASNCRCSTIEIFPDERIANTKQPPDSRVIDGKTFRPEPDEGFAFNPGIVRSLLGGAPATRNLV